MLETSKTGASARLAPTDSSDVAKVAPAASEEQARSDDWPRDMNEPSPPASIWGADPKELGDA
jgi:hypothetical protein